MKREIIINSSLVETRVAVIEDGTLVELLIDNTHTQSLAGNIYKGRVLKILPGMQAAFVDIGLARDAFLYVRDIYEEMEDYEHLLTLGDGDGDGDGGGDGDAPDQESASSRRKVQRNRPRRPSHASIEELIQEGQEVLVQVAREPLGT